MYNYELIRSVITKVESIYFGNFSWNEDIIQKCSEIKEDIFCCKVNYKKFGDYTTASFAGWIVAESVGLSHVNNTYLIKKIAAELIGMNEIEKILMFSYLPDYNLCEEKTIEVFKGLIADQTTTILVQFNKDKYLRNILINEVNGLIAIEK